MNVSKVRIPNFVRNVVVTAPLLLATQAAMPKSYGLQEDLFVKSEKIEKKDTNELSPRIKIDGQVVYPVMVVDLSDKLLYHYDPDGYLLEEYPVRFVENAIKPGINIVELTKHDYGEGITSPKIILTKINQNNGRVAKAPQQVIVGSKGTTKDDDSGIFTNVVLVDNKVAQKITEFLSDEQFILIRK